MSPFYPHLRLLVWRLKWTSYSRNSSRHDSGTGQPGLVLVGAVVWFRSSQIIPSKRR